MRVHSQAPVLGTGAGAYGTLRLRYRLDGRQVRHAHGYVVQTLADLGWVGLGLSLIAAFTWLGTVARTLGIRRRDRGLPWDAERVGLTSIAAVAVVFGLHSAWDWTWFVPGNVVPALLCAGWVVSRPTLRERLRRLRRSRRLPAGPVACAPSRRRRSSSSARSWRRGAPSSRCAPTCAGRRRRSVSTTASSWRRCRSRELRTIETRFRSSRCFSWPRSSRLAQGHATAPALGALEQAIDLGPPTRSPGAGWATCRLAASSIREGRFAAPSRARRYFLDPAAPQPVPT